MGGASLTSNKLGKQRRGKIFFQGSARYIAENLVGDFLVFKNKKQELVGKIVETEGYLGIKDDASHSFGAKITPRNRIMYNAGGIIYVYLIYGKYWCFNIVVSKRDDPQAVFIRALEPVKGLEFMKKNRPVKNIKSLTNGPCRWTQSFGIDNKLLNESITSDRIFIIANRSKKEQIVKAKRIGIDYANKSKNAFLRFYIKDNLFVSKW